MALPSRQERGSPPPASIEGNSTTALETRLIQRCLDAPPGAVAWKFLSEKHQQRMSSEVLSTESLRLFLHQRHGQILEHNPFAAEQIVSGLKQLLQPSKHLSRQQRRWYEVAKGQRALVLGTKEHLLPLYDAVNLEKNVFEITHKSYYQGIDDEHPSQLDIVFWVNGMPWVTVETQPPGRDLMQAAQRLDERQERMPEWNIPGLLQIITDGNSSAYRSVAVDTLGEWQPWPSDGSQAFAALVQLLEPRFLLQLHQCLASWTEEDEHWDLMVPSNIRLGAIQHILQRVNDRRPQGLVWLPQEWDRMQVIVDSANSIVQDSRHPQSQVFIVAENKEQRTLISELLRQRFLPFSTEYNDKHSVFLLQRHEISSLVVPHDKQRPRTILALVDADTEERAAYRQLLPTATLIAFAQEPPWKELRRLWSDPRDNQGMLWSSGPSGKDDAPRRRKTAEVEADILQDAHTDSDMPSTTPDPVIDSEASQDIFHDPLAQEDIPFVSPAAGISTANNADIQATQERLRGFIEQVTATSTTIQQFNPSEIAFYFGLRWPQIFGWQYDPLQIALRSRKGADTFVIHDADSGAQLHVQTVDGGADMQPIVDNGQLPPTCFVTNGLEYWLLNEGAVVQQVIIDQIDVQDTQAVQDLMDLWNVACFQQDVSRELRMLLQDPPQEVRTALSERLRQQGSTKTVEQYLQDLLNNLP